MSFHLRWDNQWWGLQFQNPPASLFSLSSSKFRIGIEQEEAVRYVGGQELQYLQVEEYLQEVEEYLQEVEKYLQEVVEYWQEEVGKKYWQVEEYLQEVGGY